MMPVREPPTPAYGVAESIAARDLNNLYLTSRFFADPARYWSFCALYAVMRVVDDRVDALPSRSGLSDAERVRELAAIDDWEASVAAIYAGEVPPAHGPEAPPEAREIRRALLEAMADAHPLFPVPWELWREFFAAMRRDIHRPRFSSYREFLRYAEGATVAPTTIYLILLAAQAKPDGGPYRLPAGFDPLAAGRALGLFAYLTHIIRDLAEDLATGEEGLLYLAADDMRAFGVSEEMLRADMGRGGASPQLTALLAELGDRARGYLERGRQALESLQGKLTPDCAYILELIVAVYREALDKIAAVGFDPFTGRHRLTAEDKARVAEQTARRIGMPSVAALAGIV